MATQYNAMLTMAIASGGLALIVARRLNRGYIHTLERSLVNRAVELELSDIEDITTRTAILKTRHLTMTTPFATHESRVDAGSAASDAEAVALAEDYFPWWNRELSGDEFAKFGMVVCWNDVRWVSPVGDAEELALGTALECFEQARAVGTRREIPELLRAELTRLASPDAPTHPPGPEGVGYRRRVVTVSLPGDWEVEVPGYFHDAVEDEGGTLVYWLEPRTLRASTLSFESKRWESMSSATAAPRPGSVDPRPSAKTRSARPSATTS
jgi:hypothetical protein